MKKLSVLLVLIALEMLAGCTDATKARLLTYGSSQTVCLRDEHGRLVHKWRSTGKVETTSGGVHVFEDEEKGEYVKITGGIIVVAKTDYCQEGESK